MALPPRLQSGWPGDGRKRALLSIGHPTALLGRRRRPPIGSPLHFGENRSCPRWFRDWFRPVTGIPVTASGLAPRRLGRFRDGLGPGARGRAGCFGRVFTDGAYGRTATWGGGGHGRLRGFGARTERSGGSPARSGGSSGDKGTDRQERGGGPGGRLQPGGRVLCALGAWGSSSKSNSHRQHSEAGLRRSREAAAVMACAVAAGRHPQCSVPCLSRRQLPVRAQ